MDSPVSAEAVEAAAQVLCEDDFGRAAWARLEAGTRKMTFARYCGVARRALAAALPYLPQPAHAVPSVEEVAEAVRFAQGVPFVGSKQRKIAAAILALFASQPTVRQVREQVAAEIERERWSTRAGRRKDGTDVIYERLARIARGETKEDSRG